MLISAEINSSVTEIGHNAFSYCSGLEVVTIGEGAETDDDSVFLNITIPRSVTIIYDSAIFYVLP